MKIVRGVAGSSPNFPQIRDTIWPFRRVFSSHLVPATSSLTSWTLETDMVIGLVIKNFTGP